MTLADTLPAGTVILGGTGNADKLLSAIETTVPPDGAGPFNVTVTVVDVPLRTLTWPLATFRRGVTERDETESCPVLNVETVDQAPYCCGLRAWTSQKYCVPGVKSPGLGVNEVPTGVESMMHPDPQVDTVGLVGKAAADVATMIL